MITFNDITYNSLTPMMKQYYDIKIKSQDHILFYRLGDFYEMFFDDAILVSKLLNLTLTQRECGLSEKAPMCGVPYHASKNYIARLLDEGYSIAICEQLEDASQSKSLVKRDIIKIITPGTIIDDDLLTSSDNNFILSVFECLDLFYISYLDISVGEVFVLDYKISSIDKVFDIIYNVNPKEILTNSEHIHEQLSLETLQTKYIKDTNSDDYINIFLSKLNASIKKNDIFSVNLIIQYLIQNKLDFRNHIKVINIINENKYMILDRSVIKNLEIYETLKGEKKGSLLDVIDNTSTSFGSRLLKHFLRYPLLDQNEINNRLNDVEIFKSNYIISQEISKLLKDFPDLERLNNKIMNHDLSINEILVIKNTLQLIPTLINKFKEINYCSEINEDNKYMDIIKNIEEIINDNFEEDNRVIKPGISEKYDELYNIVKDSTKILLSYEEDLKLQHNTKNLRIKYNNMIGYFIEVSKLQSQKVVNHLEKIQSLKNVERFTSERLKEIEQKIIYSDKLLETVQNQLIQDLIDNLSKHSEYIKRIIKIISYVDVIISFSISATKYKYNKPILGNERKIIITNGRHPVVERFLSSQSYIKNDTEFTFDKNICILTGPNMSGKSTYMRQIAIIQIMAQIGSFVSADNCTTYIFDHIFTRIGASDSIHTGESTFMLEMNEVNNILNNITDNSLVILDEIGRGTSTFDGMSIALSIIKYLSSTTKAIVLLSTHYHELSLFLNDYSNIIFKTLEIKESGEKILFLRKIIDGVADKSYGIHVAKLAGINEIIIRDAFSYLDLLEKNKISFTNSDSKNIESTKNNNNINSINLIKNIDINNLTPLEAMNILSKLIQEIKEYE